VPQATGRGVTPLPATRQGEPVDSWQAESSSAMNPTREESP
jgi:hypothetical protein